MNAAARLGLGVPPPRMIPVLLLKDCGLVKGLRFKDFKYLGDPMNAVRIFNQKNVDELFLLDITATAEGRVVDAALVGKVAEECHMPFGVGGGIRTVEQIRALTRAGAEKVSINTAAIENPGLIREASGIFGSQSVTVSIDFRRDFFGRGFVVGHCGTRRAGLDPVSWAREAESLGAGEILLCSVDRDGGLGGYDLKMVKAVSDAVSIPVLALGGAGGLGDFAAAVESGAAAVAAGSFFVFHGIHRAFLINYPEESVRMALFNTKERGS